MMASTAVRLAGRMADAARDLRGDLAGRNSDDPRDVGFRTRLAVIEANLRAFLADPAVLILDEATSSLDIPSERLVQRALRTILADRTAFVIAHRLSTVETADRVIVLEDGEIVEDGSPAELIHGRGRYAALHTAWEESLA